MGFEFVRKWKGDNEVLEAFWIWGLRKKRKEEKEGSNVKPWNVECCYILIFKYRFVGAAITDG